MKYLMLIFGVIVNCCSLCAQDLKQGDVARIVEMKNFIFKAQTANPARGGSRQLTSEYDLAVRLDSLVSFLPFFGRAFVAPISPDDNGIKFTSTDFSYKVRQGRKGRYEITMKPNDVSAVQQIYLTISASGMSRLQVISLNRDVMSYNGFIAEGKAIEKKAF